MGPPVPFVTMLPFYGFPSETEASNRSGNHYPRDRQMDGVLTDLQEAIDDIIRACDRPLHSSPGAASKSSAVFIHHGPGAVRDVAPQIYDGLLQGSSTQH